MSKTTDDRRIQVPRRRQPSDRTRTFPSKRRAPAKPRIAQKLDAPTTESQLEQLGRQRAAGRLAWGRFIGRAEEPVALHAAIDAVLGGKASLVMVAGEPGIGKTWLGEEGGECARLRGAQVLVGRCYQGEAASPYSSFVEAIREHASTRPNDTGGRALRARTRLNRNIRKTHGHY